MADNNSPSCDNPGVKFVNGKSYHDIWALLHFKLSAMTKSGKTEIEISQILSIMQNLESKVVK